MTVAPFNETSNMTPNRARSTANRLLQVNASKYTDEGCRNPNIKNMSHVLLLQLFPPKLAFKIQQQHSMPLQEDHNAAVTIVPNELEATR